MGDSQWDNRPVILSADQCSKCGQDHDRCCGHEPETDARGQNTGFWRPCRRLPKAGERNCFHHAGPQGAVYSRGREILQAHHRPMGNVLQELQGLFEELTALKDHMLAQIEGDSISEKEAASFRRTIKQCSEVGAVIAKLNIDERLVAIEEGKARLMAAVVLKVLSDPSLALSPEQLKQAQRTVAREMRAIDKPAAA